MAKKFEVSFVVIIIVNFIHLFLSGSNMLGYLRCKLGGGGGEASLSNIANAYIQKSMVRKWYYITEKEIWEISLPNNIIC